MFVVPYRFHAKCLDCNSYFEKSVGDCIGPFGREFTCPYCRSRNIERAEASSLKEGLSYIRYKVKKILK